MIKYSDKGCEYFNEQRRECMERVYNFSAGPAVLPEEVRSEERFSRNAETDL